MNKLCKGLFSNVLHCIILLYMWFIIMRTMFFALTEPQRMVLFSHDGGVAVFNPNARVTSSVLSLSGVDSFGYNYQDGVSNNYPNM